MFRIDGDRLQYVARLRARGAVPRDRPRRGCGRPGRAGPSHGRDPGHPAGSRDRALAGDAGPGRVPPTSARSPPSRCSPATGCSACSRSITRSTSSSRPRTGSSWRRWPPTPRWRWRTPALRRDPPAPGDGRGARRHHADPGGVARPANRARGRGGRRPGALRGGRWRHRPHHPARDDAGRRPRRARSGCAPPPGRGPGPGRHRLGAPARPDLPHERLRERPANHPDPHPGDPAGGHPRDARGSRPPAGGDRRDRLRVLEPAGGALGRAREPGDRPGAHGGRRGRERAALPGSAGPGGRGAGPVRGRPPDQLHPGSGPGLRSDRRAGARADARAGVRDLPPRPGRPPALRARGRAVAGVHPGHGGPGRRGTVGPVRSRAPAGVGRRSGGSRNAGAEQRHAAAGRPRGIPGRAVRADPDAGRAVRLPGHVLVGAPRAHRRRRSRPSPPSRRSPRSRSRTRGSTTRPAARWNGSSSSTASIERCPRCFASTTSWTRSRGPPGPSAMRPSRPSGWPTRPNGPWCAGPSTEPRKCGSSFPPA